MFRPPSLLSPQIVPTAAPTAAGQPGILRPGLSCFVTSTRTGYANRLTQAIDGTGTFTLPDFQPCRLLIPCSGDFSSGTRGLHQPLDVSLSPCCRFHPAKVGMPHRSDFGTPCCLRPSVAGSALGPSHFRGHICVYCRYGPVTRNLPKGDLVDGLSGLRELSFPPSCHPNYRAPDFCPGRSISC